MSTTQYRANTLLMQQLLQVDLHCSPVSPVGVLFYCVVCLNSKPVRDGAVVMRL